MAKQFSVDRARFLAFAAAFAGAASFQACSATDTAPGGECNDSTGVATCTGVTTACSNYCNAALHNLKPAVADAAIGCLKLDTTSNCDNGYKCLADATAKGCRSEEHTSEL